MAFPHDVLNEGAPTLKAGDEVLRYGLNSDGDWNLWAKGALHQVNSEEVVDKGSFFGFGDQSMCYIAVTERREKNGGLG
jgi:hypothetical protein